MPWIFDFTHHCTLRIGEKARAWNVVKRYSDGNIWMNAYPVFTGSSYWMPLASSATPISAEYKMEWSKPTSAKIPTVSHRIIMKLFHWEMFQIFSVFEVRYCQSEFTTHQFSPRHSQVFSLPPWAASHGRFLSWLEINKPRRSITRRSCARVFTSKWTATINKSAGYDQIIIYRGSKYSFLCECTSE